MLHLICPHLLVQAFTHPPKRLALRCFPAGPHAGTLSGEAASPPARAPQQQKQKRGEPAGAHRPAKRTHTKVPPQVLPLGSPTWLGGVWHAVVRRAVELSPSGQPAPLLSPSLPPCRLPPVVGASFPSPPAYHQPACPPIPLACRATSTPAPSLPTGVSVLTRRARQQQRREQHRRQQRWEHRPASWHLCRAPPGPAGRCGSPSGSPSRSRCACRRGWAAAGCLRRIAVERQQPRKGGCLPRLWLEAT